MCCDILKENCASKKKYFAPSLHINIHSVRNYYFGKMLFKTHLQFNLTKFEFNKFSKGKLSILDQMLTSMFEYKYFLNSNIAKAHCKGNFQYKNNKPKRLLDAIDYCYINLRRTRSVCLLLNTVQNRLWVMYFWLTDMWQNRIIWSPA